MRVLPDFSAQTTCFDLQLRISGSLNVEWRFILLSDAFVHVKTRLKFDHVLKLEVTNWKPLFHQNDVKKRAHFVIGVIGGPTLDKR